MIVTGTASAKPLQQQAGTTSEDPFGIIHERLVRAVSETAAASPRVPPSNALAPTTASHVIGSFQSREEAIHEFSRRYWRGRDDDLAQALGRLTQLRPVIEPILRREGIPTELIAVALVESAARRDALSLKGARGLWQFMPATAQRYGLAVGADRDDRTDVVLSTLAAARYLHDLYLRFGSWPLALAAYNTGEQSVQTAISRSGRTEFDDLSALRLLPEETRNYVPTVQAAARLFQSDMRGGWLNTNNATKRKSVVVLAYPDTVSFTFGNSNTGQGTRISREER